VKEGTQKGMHMKFCSKENRTQIIGFLEVGREVAMDTDGGWWG
jgi:hypothetical protein